VRAHRLAVHLQQEAMQARADVGAERPHSLDSPAAAGDKRRAANREGGRNTVREPQRDPLDANTRVKAPAAPRCAPARQPGDKRASRPA
jgi:hypothetical protein